jgi:hypothetical protein
MSTTPLQGPVAPAMIHMTSACFFCLSHPGPKFATNMPYNFVFSAHLLVTELKGLYCACGLRFGGAKAILVA